ncbi:MAG TPA: WD40 repeat domain-containing protein [Thermoanaerobaculia bacterium]|nr:WD40 repeat domain-containing protein [Thermoanaerobaculia bacterium]
MSERSAPAAEPDGLISIRSLVSEARRSEINSICWSPDGTRLALGDDEHAVEVITAEGGTLWRRIEDVTRIWSVCWSPDGRWLGSLSEEGVVRLWDPRTGSSRRLSSTPTQGTSKKSLAWSPSADRLAWTAQRELMVATADTGEVLFSCAHSGLIREAAWSPDGSRFAACSDDGKVWLWNGGGSHLTTLVHEGVLQSVQWSPDGKLLASAASNGTLRIWDAADYRCRVARQFHLGSGLIALSWFPEGGQIAIGGHQDWVRIVAADDGHEIAAMTGTPAPVWSVAFSPDGSRLAASGIGFQIGQVGPFLPTRTSRTSKSLAAYAARQSATVGRRPAAVQRDPWVPKLPRAERACLGVLQVATESNDPHQPGVDVFADGKTLATGHPDGMVRRWDLRSGLPIWVGKERHAERVNDVKVSPQSTMIASGSGDQTLRIWAAETGDCIRTLNIGANCLRVAWSPAGEQVAAVGVDGSITIWNWSNGGLATRCFENRETVWGVSWSPDGLLLATASLDGTVRTWDPQSGVAIHSINAHSHWVQDVQWSPDGQTLASSSRDATVALWDTRTWELRLRHQSHAKSNYGLNCVSWSPDGSLVASAGYDQVVRVWDSSTGLDVAEFPFPEEYAWRLAWSPDGAFLVSSHIGAVFRFWDTRLLTAGHHDTVALPAAGPLARELAVLPAALAGLHRLGLYPPLSLLAGLLDQLGGHQEARSLDRDGESLAALGKTPGFRDLANLRWPAAARVGLAALLLREAPFEGWRPSATFSAAEISVAIGRALRSDTVEPQAPPPPLAALQQAAEAVDDRLLTLLSALGPEAVAADPGLPLRLLPRLPAMPPLSAPRRQLLGIRLRSGAAGRSLGHGPGSERSGVDLRGDLRSLLPSQLALPPELLTGRHLRGELLYRARTGEEAPRLRPAVLLLDVSPPSYGPVEAMTRLAAHVLASSLLQAGLPVVLVTAGGHGEVHSLDRLADLVEIWTRRSLEPAAAGQSLRAARALRETLREGPLEPAVVLLAHAYFGAEDQVPAQPCLRGLFVQYPGQHVRPPLAGACERWESIAAGDTAMLADRLARVAG